MYSWIEATGVTEGGPVSAHIRDGIVIAEVSQVELYTALEANARQMPEELLGFNGHRYGKCEQTLYKIASIQQHSVPT